MNNKQNKSISAFRFSAYLGFFILSVALFSCGKDEQSAVLQVRLTDSPGDYQKVNIDIQGIEVHNEGGTQTSGWIALDVVEGTYNLLDLTNGLDTLLGTASLPAGVISQIRLVLGSNNNIMVNGVTSVLSTPSGQQSGLKLNVHAELKAGITYVITLDFDAARSIVKSGNGTYSLKPVIRAISEPTTGAISGTIIPLAAAPAIFAIQGSDTVATCYPDDNGRFLLRAVPDGTYVVSFSPTIGYSTLQKVDVVVTIGNVTSLGLVTIL